MLYPPSAGGEPALGLRKRFRKRLKTDSPEVDHRFAIPGDRVVLASSNFRSDPFGTVFPIGLGEPWGTDSRGSSRGPIPKSSRRAEPEIGLGNNCGNERKTTDGDPYMT